SSFSIAPKISGSTSASGLEKKASVFDMVKAPETVMRWRLSALPEQEQYGERDLPVKLRRRDEKWQLFSGKAERDGNLKAALR
ncbi:MAG: hypothetical protein J0G97_07160, partial [Rhizobium pusense]|nr:hypothetical protein [Agrobacterium pusense]